MANVLFNRVEDSTQLDNIPVVDGSFYVTGDGKSFIDYGEERLPVGGTPDTEMSDRSRNTVENNVIKQYVDNSIISRKLLWTNPNPTSTFNSQSITLSSDDYDVLEWFYRSDVNGNRTASSRCLKGSSVQFDMFSLGIATRRWGRRADYVSDTQYTVGNASVFEQGQSQQTINEQCVPLYVIGYKTGLFE